MPTRSWLFVPGDSEKKLAKVASCGADAEWRALARAI